MAVPGLVLFGSVAALELVWAMADLFMDSMELVNLVAIGLLAAIAFAALRDYRTQRKAGKDPTFHVTNIRGLRNVESWGESDRSGRQRRSAGTGPVEHRNRPELATGRDRRLPEAA